MSLQTYNHNAVVKVLYTFDNDSTFLVRSTRPLSVKLIKLPTQPANEPPTYGCIDLRRCLSLVSSTSPEWFQQDKEYSIYSKDVMEPGEPFVGYGLWSKLKDRRSAVLITGQICRSVLSICSGNGSMGETLEVKIRFAPIQGKSSSSSSSNNNSNSSSNSTKRSSSHEESARSGTSNNSSNNSNGISVNTGGANAGNSDTNSSPAVHSDEFQEPMKRRKSNVSALKSAPQLATRTQSLPFISENSLAHRILLSDNNSNSTSSTNVASRFSSYSKLMRNSPPTKARKTKSFIKSVVKIGDNAIEGQLPPSVSLQKCVNCSSVSDPPYKFHRDGLYEFGNAGMLCNVCHCLQQKSDTEGLRRRGEMGAKGLLDGPYKSSKRRNRRKTNHNSNHNFLGSSGSSSSNNSNNGSHTAGLSSSTGSSSSPQIESDDLPGRPTYQSMQIQPTDVDPVFRNGAGKSDDAAPIATKLNTTLIPLEEEDDKENQEPDHTVADADGSGPTLLGAEISPSIQRILESFSNGQADQGVDGGPGGVPGSPTKVSTPLGGPDWTNFFNMFQPEDDGGNADTGGTLGIVEETTEEDPEVSRVLGKSSKNSPPTKTPADKFDATPADADTVPAEQSPTNMVVPAHPMTPFTQLLEQTRNAKNVSNANNNKKKGIIVPSSPYFLNQQEDKSSDSTRTTDKFSSSNWESSPLTEPLEPVSGEKA